MSHDGFAERAFTLDERAFTLDERAFTLAERVYADIEYTPCAHVIHQ